MRCIIEGGSTNKSADVPKQRGLRLAEARAEQASPSLLPNSLFLLLLGSSLVSHPIEQSRPQHIAASGDADAIPMRCDKNRQTNTPEKATKQDQTTATGKDCSLRSAPFSESVWRLSERACGAVPSRSESACSAEKWCSTSERWSGKA